MVKKELFNKDTICLWICMIVAGLFIYGKYFVAITELDKVNYGISAMLWILLGLVIAYSISTQKLIKEIAKTRTTEQSS